VGTCCRVGRVLSCQPWGLRPRLWLGAAALLAFYISVACARIGRNKKKKKPGSSIARRLTSAVLKIVAGQGKASSILCADDSCCPLERHADLTRISWERAKVTPALQSYMALIYNIGAIPRRHVVGQLSERRGSPLRRTQHDHRDDMCAGDVVAVWRLASST